MPRQKKNIYVYTYIYIYIYIYERTYIEQMKEQIKAPEKIQLKDEEIATYQMQSSKHW